jgi:hypothetical protein
MTEVPMEQLASVVGAEVDEFSRAVVIALFNGVIRDTRVDTGRLRGDWQTTTGSPAMAEAQREDKIPQGVDGGAAQEEVVDGVRSETVNYLTNNMPYSEVYEQADGMVARNVARLSRIIKEKAKG